MTDILEKTEAFDRLEKALRKAMSTAGDYDTYNCYVLGLEALKGLRKKAESGLEAGTTAVAPASGDVERITAKLSEAMLWVERLTHAEGTVRWAERQNTSVGTGENGGVYVSSGIQGAMVSQAAGFALSYLFDLKKLLAALTTPATVPPQQGDACQDEGCPHYGKAVKCEPKANGCIATVPDAAPSPDCREALKPFADFYHVYRTSLNMQGVDYDEQTKVASTKNEMRQLAIVRIGDFQKAYDALVLIEAHTPTPPITAEQREAMVRDMFNAMCDKRKSLLVGFTIEQVEAALNVVIERMGGKSDA